MKCPACPSGNSSAECFPFFFVFLVNQRGSFLVFFFSFSLRVAFPCLKNRQVVLGCAHRRTYNTSHKKALRSQLLHPQGHWGTSRGVPHSFWSAFSDTVYTLHVAGPQQTRQPSERKQRRERQVTDGFDVSWISEKAKTYRN